MRQSFIIFAVIVILKAIMTAIAKKQEAKKKEELQRALPRETKTRAMPVTAPPRESPAMQAWVDARAARAKAPVLESASTIDLKADARRRAHLAEQTPIKSAPIHAAEGEATFEQLARTVAAIHGGVLARSGGETRSPIATPSVRGKPATAPQWLAHGAAVRSRFQARKSIIAFEIFSPPVSMR
ncbi:MAG: hypothetical protein EXS17_08620 [Phycisphaerales bacterium]|nr:hypothetical protein [Phycisphaerales bacterium]